MRSLLITGTDTGVGKTFVGCGLAAALTARGKRVGVLKPVETGCALRDGELYPEDALRLAAFARSTLPIDQLCPYRFGQWHNRVRNSYYLIRRNPQVRTLETRRLDELRGRDIRRRNPLSFKVGDIVRTARDARPSRAEGFNDRIAL